MEKHKCKICSRTFTNGRALGGHMKAHLATLKRLPPKPQSPSFSSFSQSQEQQQKPLIYADLEFSAPDRESDTESSKNPTRQLRSKRNRKSNYKHFTALSTTTPSPPLSSVSNTSPEEDVAMCLMMLSRDKWKKHNNNNNNNINIVESTPLKKRVRGKHVCENCRKVFRSSKALTNHTTVCYPHYHHHENEEDNNSKTFECEFCLKVFGSGQALGGHKRSHLIIPSSSSTSRMLNFKDGFIDLNLPAPLEDDDLSVLSDA